MITMELMLGGVPFSMRVAYRIDIPQNKSAVIPVHVGVCPSTLNASC
jgi:hypothetical protein